MPTESTGSGQSMGNYVPTTFTKSFQIPHTAPITLSSLLVLITTLCLSSYTSCPLTNTLAGPSEENWRP